MAELPRGVPYIEILAPAGTSAKVEDLQTRLDLIGAHGWIVRGDDGTMEHSAVPMQPLRGNLDRIQVYRQTPIAPGEPMNLGAQLTVELAMQTGAHLAGLGVYGVYAWGLLAIEDIRWLYGLMLLDWIYNPRLDERGELIESDDPVVAESAVPKKVMAFAELWTPERSAQLASKLPEGAMQEVESHQVLSLLGPGGSFDPRFWQSVALQMGIDAVRSWAAEKFGTAVEGAEPVGQPKGASAPPSPPSSSSAMSPGAGAGGTGVPAADLASVKVTPPDGLTPLQRARLEAERRTAEAAERGAEEVEEVEEEIEGGAVQWLDTSIGPVLWFPSERFDAALVRDLRTGSTDGLGRSERPSGEVLERWMENGAAFATEVSSMARLMLDNVPVYRAVWDEKSEGFEGFSSLLCQLPRVSQVRAFLVPEREDRRRRILVCSDLSLTGDELLTKSG